MKKLDEELTHAFEIQFVFNRHTLGEGFCKEVLGFTDEQLDDWSFDLLQALGFSRAQIDEANRYIFGSMTVEGARRGRLRASCASSVIATAVRRTSRRSRAS